MRDAGLSPKLHLFVCGNRREAGSPLGPGCGAAGDALFARLKELVAERRAWTSVWVTSTACLGVCPRGGAAVACYAPSGGGRVLADATAEDAEAILALDLRAGDDVERLLEDMESLQTTKVLDLARRLKPGLTLEDVKNPHDFPELADPDWHYEDGVLTGIQSVLAAVRQRART